MFDTGQAVLFLFLVSDDFKPEDDLRCAHRHSSVLANHAGM
jgi:hypothetical protein